MKTIYKHRYIQAICEILEITNKGNYKILFCEYKKKPKQMYFEKSLFDDAFIKVD